MYEVGKNLLPYDLEVYRNYFLFGAIGPKGELIQSCDQILLRNLLANWYEHGYELVGFNSKSYDDRVMKAYLASGGDPEAAYRRSKEIIEGGDRAFEEVPYPSVDLIRVLPGIMSLKKLGVIMGHPRLQE